MRLHDTVKRFCTETFEDATNPAVTFKGKVNPFSEVTNSGESAMRRVLETEPTTVIPASKVVKGPDGRTFILSKRNIDYWDGTPIRYKYSMVPVFEGGAYGSIGEILAGTPEIANVFGYPHFVRREILDQEMSDYLSGYDIYFPDTVNLKRGKIYLTESGTYYHLRTDTSVDGIGFLVAQGLKIEDPIKALDISIVSGSYDPVTDSYPRNPAIQVTVFVEPMIKDYEFVNPSFEDVEPGDKAISVLKSDITVNVNDMIDKYRILSIRDMGDFVTCHCRFEN